MLAGFVILWGLGPSAVHPVSCRHILGHACLIRPGVGHCVFLSYSCSYHQSRRCVLDVPVISEPRRRLCSGCLSSSSSSCHHLVRRGRSFLSSSCSASSHWCPLFSSEAAIVRRTESVASHQSLRLVLIELGKTARNMISRSSSSDALGLLVPRLALSSRGASRALFVIVMVARGEGRVLRSCLCSCRLVGGGAECPAAWRRACPHPSLTVSFASRRLVSWGVSLLVLRCPAGFGGEVVFVLPCLPASPNCSSRLVGRGVMFVSSWRLVFSSRGAGRLWLLVLS